MKRANINVTGGLTGAENSINGQWRWVGPWVSGKTYQRGQVVESEGSSWIALGVTTTKPSSTNTAWQLIALKGLDGTPGIIWTGAFDNGRQYNVGEAVYFGGSAYINIAPSQNIEPTNPAYWSILVRSLNPGGVLNLVIGPEDSIQEAIDTVADAGGGTVILKGGTYEVDYDIQMKSQVTLQSEGFLTATIDFLGTSSSLCFNGEEVYATGTVSATAGTTTITGSGTAFTGTVEPGHEIFLDGIFYPIVEVVSDTELEVAMPLISNITNAPTRIGIPITLAYVEQVALTNSATFAVRANYANEMDVSDWRVTECGGVMSFSNTTNSRIFNGDAIGNGVGIVYDNTHFSQVSAVGIVNTAIGSAIVMKNGSANNSWQDNFILGQAEHGIHIQDSGPLVFGGTTVSQSGADGILVERSQAVIFNSVKSTESAGHGFNIQDSAGTVIGTSFSNSHALASVNINAGSNQTTLNGSNLGPSMGGVLVDNGVDTMVAGCIPENINTGGGGDVDSVNGQTGVVVLDADDIAETASRKYFEASERLKLAGIEAGAEVNTVTSVAGKTGAVTLAKADVGLGNVDNTSDSAKPISTATQAALDGKVDKVTGKGLSTEDYTTAEKNKLAGIEAGAQANTVTSVAGKTGAVTLAKGDVGLGNVDNTSDANKPISTATQSALDGKVDKVTGKGLSSEDYTTAEKNKLAGIEAGAEVNVQSDWNASSGVAEILNKPTLGTMAAEDASDYTKTSNLGALASKNEVEISDIDATGTPSGTTYLAGDGTWKTPAGGGSGIQTIQEGTGIDVDSTDPANPTVGLDSATQASLGKADSAVQPSTLADVATSGDYDDLDNKPTIPAAQVNSDWDAVSGVAEILNKPTLGTMAAEDASDYTKTANLGDLALKNKVEVSDIDSAGTPSGTTFLAGDGSWKAVGSGSASWGSIGGDINNQTDLQSALAGKLSDAPSDGKQYAREDGAWTEVTGGGGSSPWEDNPELDGGIKYEDGDLLVGESMAGAGSKMFFNATKSAFRAGNVNGTQWNDANVGFGSFAGGDSASARNAYSFAFGSNLTRAYGDNSFAFGNQAFADTINSVAIGAFTHANVHSMIAFGRYNTGSGNPTSWVATDPLFVIGNGTNGFNRSNALTLLKNATLGINTHEPDLSSILDLTSTDRGFLPPRMTETQRDAITSPATGLVVYNTDENALNLYDGSAWVAVGGGTDKKARNSTTSAGSLTPNLTTAEYQEYTALAAAFTLNAPTGGVTGDNFHLVVTATGANRNITFNASYQFLENNDAPTEIEVGFTYDFVITKTDSRFIISWGRVEN